MKPSASADRPIGDEELQRFRETISGAVLDPAHPDYEEARRSGTERSTGIPR
jgi:hypothetical protein